MGGWELLQSSSPPHPLWASWSTTTPPHTLVLVWDLEDKFQQGTLADCPLRAFMEMTLANCLSVACTHVDPEVNMLTEPHTGQCGSYHKAA